MHNMWTEMDIVASERLWYFKLRFINTYLLYWHGLYRLHFLPSKALVLCDSSIEHFPPRQQGSRGQHGAHLGPVGPRWAPCRPHELCYQGSGSEFQVVYVVGTPDNQWSIREGDNKALWFPLSEKHQHTLHIHCVLCSWRKGVYLQITTRRKYRAWAYPQ